jgi:hypothetical protein
MGIGGVAICKKIYVLDDNNDLSQVIIPKNNGASDYRLYVPNNTDSYTFCFVPPFINSAPKWYYNIKGMIQ